jgi:hypothetical protein
MEHDAVSAPKHPVARAEHTVGTTWIAPDPRVELARRIITESTNRLLKRHPWLRPAPTKTTKEI